MMLPCAGINGTCCMYTRWQWHKVSRSVPGGKKHARAVRLRCSMCVYLHAVGAVQRALVTFRGVVCAATALCAAHRRRMMLASTDSMEALRDPVLVIQLGCSAASCCCVMTNVMKGVSRGDSWPGGVQCS
jgi:hypothetical protein